MNLTMDQKINLLNMKFKIIVMKADHYNWSCHVPQETKDQLEEMLVSIEKQLKEKGDE